MPSAPSFNRNHHPGTGRIRLRPTLLSCGHPRAHNRLPWFKHPPPFIIRASKGPETCLEDMQGSITPNHLFFVRNNSPNIARDPKRWRLNVEGDPVTAT